MKNNHGEARPLLDFMLFYLGLQSFITSIRLMSLSGNLPQYIAALAYWDSANNTETPFVPVFSWKRGQRAFVLSDLPQKGIIGPYGETGKKGCKPFHIQRNLC